MRHYTKAEWLKFVRNRPLPMKREIYEDHLYSCDQCLDIYMECLEMQSFELPDIETDQKSEFAEKILKGLPKTAASSPHRLYSHPLLHYGIAAAITLLLMTSGVFHDIYTYLGYMDINVVMEDQPKLSEMLMEKSTSILDAIKLK
jgi:hypothetical protein